ncbi:hypothetical protein [Accumulibacter sp.]|uniref:hypothetical protein n=1 Tax=Accumulibacter sp. TaxID=2053492 RepID=UPI002639C188|nr:hypothetical protein [Accumulibacter sp.]
MLNQLLGGMDVLAWGSITTNNALNALTSALQRLCGVQVNYLQLPADLALQIEPSQVGTIVGTLTDLLLPRIALEQGIGLTKAAGILGDREDYPDFEHNSGYRIELKGAFRDNPHVPMKRPPTPREPSARLTQKVTVKNVDPDRDALLILVYELRPTWNDPSLLSPTIVDLGLFPVIECINARDHRMISGGGRWFGNYETPTILSKAGKRAVVGGVSLNSNGYGRKESEGYHFNEDTNFGKLKRIPYRPLQEFLKRAGCQFSATGSYPVPWSMSKQDQEFALALDMTAENGGDSLADPSI